MSPLEPLVAPGPELTPDQLARYSRHLTLPGVGPEGQRRIRNARVLVVGAGGLGAPIINYLVAAGVGQLSVIDDDVVEASNLQRQVIHRHQDLGRAKAESARQAALRLDPQANLTAVVDKLTRHNAVELFAAHDLVLDGTDNFATRYLSNDAAELSGTPLIWGTIFRFSGQVSVFAPGRGPMLRDLFPEIPDADSVPSCAEGGVFGALCGVVGSTMAAEALKLICGIGEPLIGRFWRYDALQATTDILRFAEDPHRQPVTELQDYEHGCALPATVRQIDAGQLQDGQGRNQVLVVDVREAWEREMGSIPGSVHIPLERLTEQGWAALDGLATADQLVLACKSGVRSQRAARILSEERPDAQVFSLQGGTVQWFEEVRGRTLVY